MIWEPLGDLKISVVMWGRIAANENTTTLFAAINRSITINMDSMYQGVGSDLFHEMSLKFVRIPH